MSETAKQGNVEGVLEIVYELWFIREYPNRADTELHIGVYASEEEATAAIEQLKPLPGFRDYPKGFEIHPTRLGLTNWRAGFVTEYGGPPKGAKREAFDLPAWF